MPKMTDQAWRDHFGKSQKRTLAVSKEGIDVEKRTVPVAFSSETPVMRWCWDGDYEEILDHSPGAMRTERLNGGLAVLFNHDRNLHLGTIEPDSGRIDKDKVGRAVARFGNGALASEKFQDVQDGILGLTSFLYDVHAFDVINGADGKVTVRITDWEPLEISFVTIPADPAVGVGRSKVDPTEEKTPSISTAEPAVTTTEEGKRMFKRMREYLKSRGLATDATTDQEVSDAFSRLSDEDKARAFGGVPAGSVEAEQKRTAEILELGEKHGFRDDALQFVREKKSVDEFKNHVLEKRAKSAGIVTHLDLSKRELGEYSLLRAIRAMKSGDTKGAAFEFECSRAIADKIGKEPRGIFVPFDAHPVRAAHANRMQRDMAYAARMERALNTGTDSQGGYLVASMHLASEFIQVLRPLTVLGRNGARILTGLVGNVDIPKMIATSTFYWIAEGGDVTDSGDERFGTVELKPKTIAGSVPITRRLRQQADPSIEALLIEDLAAGIGVAFDNAGLQGTGLNNQPKGVLNQTGINTQVITTAGSPDWPEIVGFETEVETDNALSLGSPAYLMHPGVKGNCKSTLRAANAGFIWDNGEVNGYRAESTNLMPANGILFGNFSEVVIGTWGVLDVKPDNAKLAASDGTVLRVFQDGDIAVRHAEAFCKNA